MQFKDIEKKIPGSWSELTLKDFLKLPLMDDEDMDAHKIQMQDVHIIMTLTGLDVIDVMKMPMEQMKKLSTKLAFRFTDIPKVKMKGLRLKKQSEITTDEFINFTQILKDVGFIISISNAIPVISMMAIKEEKRWFRKNKTTTFTPEEIENWGMDKAFAVFLMLQKLSIKSLQTTSLSLSLRLLKQSLKEIILQASRKLSRKFRRRTAGTS